MRSRVRNVFFGGSMSEHIGRSALVVCHTRRVVRFTVRYPQYGYIRLHTVQIEFQREIEECATQ